MAEIAAGAGGRLTEGAAPIPALLSWSGGKDSCMALHALRRGGRHDVRGLVTTVDPDDARIAYHGVPVALLRAQADALGLPLHPVPLPAGADNCRYEAAMRAALAGHVDAGVRTIAFGDLFLEDIRRYREGLAASIGMAPLFPIWGCDTARLVEDFAAAGFRALICAVDTARLDARFAGRLVDATLLADLPAGVDPCGENGEYHSFVFDGPLFSAPVRVATGRSTLREGMGCLELAPAP